MKVAPEIAMYSIQVFATAVQNQVAQITANLQLKQRVVASFPLV
jgi:hypothetical protein